MAKSSGKRDLKERLKDGIAEYNRVFEHGDGQKPSSKGSENAPKTPEKQSLPRLLGGAETIPAAFLRRAARRYIDGDHTLVRGAYRGLTAGTGIGLEACDHYLSDNRMLWWDDWEADDRKAKTATAPLVDRDTFKCEFNPAVRSVVTFDSLGDGQSPNDLPGKEFTLLSRGSGAPVIRRREVTREDDGGGRVRDVASVIVNEDPRGEAAETGDSERSVLVIAFDTPQRSVGLDYGFLARDPDLPPPPDDAVDISTQGVELRAFTRDGMQIVTSFGSDMSGGSASPRWVDHDTVTKRIGVRHVDGLIGYVELHFGRRAAHDAQNMGPFITEPQVVYRVWHEPFPVAAVRQSEANADSPGVTITLPFHCDRAVAFVRGFKVGFGENAHDVHALEHGLHTELQGNQILVRAVGRLRSSDQEAPLNRIKVYFTVVAWESARAELYAPAGQAELEQYVDEGSTSRGVVTVPDPCVFPSLPRSQAVTSEEACGPVWAALTELSLRPWEENGVEQFGFLADRAVRTTGDKLAWPVHTELEDVENYNSSAGGQFLAGRSLRLGPDGMPYGTAYAYATETFPVSVEAHGERPANGPPRFYWDGPQSIDFGIAWPIQAQVAFLAPGQWLAVAHQGFLHGDAPVRDVEIEFMATSYDGAVVQWTEGGGFSTHDAGDDGEHNTIFGWPSFAGIVPKTAFARPRLATQDVRFVNGVAGIVSLEPGQAGAVINQGDAPVFITRARKTGDDPMAFDVRMAVTRTRIWEGAEVLAEQEAQGRLITAGDLETGPPLQLLPGEALLVGGRFFPQEERYHSAWLQLSTSDSQAPTVSVLLDGRVGESQAVWQLQPDNVNWDGVSVGQVRSRNALITSTGQTPLLIYRMRIENPELGFSFNGPAEIGGDGGSYQLQPGGAYLVQMTFRPVQEGLVHSKLTVDTNAGSLSINLHGVGE